MDSYYGTLSQNKTRAFLSHKSSQKLSIELPSRIISMQKSGDIRGVFERLVRGIKGVGDSIKGKDVLLHPK